MSLCHKHYFLNRMDSLKYQIYIAQIQGLENQCLWLKNSVPLQFKKLFLILKHVFLEPPQNLESAPPCPKLSELCVQQLQWYQLILYFINCFIQKMKRKDNNLTITRDTGTLYISFYNHCTILVHIILQSLYDPYTYHFTIIVRSLYISFYNDCTILVHIIL